MSILSIVVAALVVVHVYTGMAILAPSVWASLFGFSGLGWSRKAVEYRKENRWSKNENEIATVFISTCWPLSIPLAVVVLLFQLNVKWFLFLIERTNRTKG